jgi:ribonuclease HI
MGDGARSWTAYADGSCIGNPGRGGWGVVLIDPAGGSTEFAGTDPSTTNNRMEITAAVEALRRVPVGAPITLHSDSQYVIKTMTSGWRRRENLDLWPLLDQETARRRVRWEWVRGHDGDPLNERADQLARSAAEGRAPRPVGAVPSATRPARAQPARRSLDADHADLSTIAELELLLRADEELRHCRGCGRLFVASGGANYCTLAPCQLKARPAKPS